MNKLNRMLIFEALRAANPTPETELEYASAFELLVAVTLSAQSTDKSVNKATRKLFAVANTPEAILSLGLDGLKSYIKTIGLFNNKAKHIIGACERLIEVFDGEVPNNRKDLESLPGVGRKTANVILSTAFGIPSMAVDTHVFRVANRTGLAKGRTPRQVEDRLMHTTPKTFLLNAHHWLVLHGRYTCLARKPKCTACPIAQYCSFPHKTA